MADSALARAQEMHTKLHNKLLEKDKQLAAAEKKQQELSTELAEAHREIEREKKRSEKALEAKEQELSDRTTDLEEREEALTQAQATLTQAQTQLDQEKAQQKRAMDDMEAHVKEVETTNLQLTRERDEQKNTNAVNQQHFHEQLISLSKNHLEQTNEDIARIAALRAENEAAKKDIAVRFSEKLVEASRVETDLRAQIASLTVRHEEDAARWAAAKQEFETIIAANAAELVATVKRVKEDSNRELSILSEKIGKDSTLITALQSWEAVRAEKENQWQNGRDECRFLRIELEKSIQRYEKLEQSTNTTIQGHRKDIQDLKAKLADTEAQLAKKSEALRVYHKEIKNNAAKLAEIQKLQAQQEKIHRMEQEKAAKEIVALGGPDRRNSKTTTSTTSTGGGFGDVLSSFFKSSSEKEKEKKEAEARAAAARARAPSVDSTTSDDTSTPVGPKRSISGVDESVENTLNEEMAVSLSKRVESLEDERLTLTAQVDQLKKRLSQAELLNQLHTPSPAKDGKGGDSSSTGSDGKKSILGSLLGKGKDGKGDKNDPLNDPAKVRALLEEQVQSNQQLTADNEKSASEVKRLKHLLDTAKDELAQAKKEAATGGKGKKKAGATNAKTDSDSAINTTTPATSSTQ